MNIFAEDIAVGDIIACEVMYWAPARVATIMPTMTGNFYMEVKPENDLHLWIFLSRGTSVQRIGHSAMSDL